MSLTGDKLDFRLKTEPESGKAPKKFMEDFLGGENEITAVPEKAEETRMIQKEETSDTVITERVGESKINDRIDLAIAKASKNGHQKSVYIEDSNFNYIMSKCKNEKGETVAKFSEVLNLILKDYIERI